MTVTLPIDAHLDAIASAVRERGAVVIRATTGSGKTTRVPPALWKRLDPAGRVVVLEPRRIAARLAAARVADELGLKVGGAIGHQVRHDDRTSRGSKVVYMTEGILTRRLMRDPTLEGVSVVVLDELHERNLHSDLALALVQRLRRGARPDLGLVAMSATLDDARLAAFVGADVVNVEGRRFEVAIEHDTSARREPLDKQVARAVRRVVREEPDGHVLVFLPGARAISEATRACQAIARDHDVALLPLHGRLPPRDQDRAVAPSARRKVVLATNVAETSITIDGVVAVIDAGLHRVARSGAGGVGALVTEPISQASATQRAGRAGRTRAGRCIRLYSEADWRQRPAFDAPAIVRADLAEVTLALRASGVAADETVDFLDAPPEAAWARARALLDTLGATRDGRLTDTGRAMAALPLPPRLARSLVEARERGVAAALAPALAILAERGSLRTGRHKRRNLWDEVEAFEALEAADFDPHQASALGLHRAGARQASRVARQLARGGGDDGGSDDDATLSLLAGHPDRVAAVRGSATAGGATSLALADGARATLADPAALGPDGFCLVLAATGGERGRPLEVRSAVPLPVEALLELFEDALESEEELVYADPPGRVERIDRMRYRQLIVDASRRPAEPSEAVGALLERVARERGLERVAGPRLDTLRTRLAYAAAASPTLPTADALIDGALRELCAGATRLDALGALVDLALATLGAEGRKQLDRLAPARIALAGGKSLAVRYAPDRPPAIASYMQDFFGMAEGPVVGQHEPVVLHLWAPNKRDVQVTSDLAGFWRNHYPTLKKSLSRRYPKHHWPDAPASAPAALLKRHLKNV